MCHYGHYESGHYEYLVMPYDLVNVPSVFPGFRKWDFQSSWNAFSLWQHLLACVLFSRTSIHHLCAVLNKLTENHLFVILEKYEFHQPLVKFLGYILDEQVVKMSQVKVEAVNFCP